MSSLKISGLLIFIAILLSTSTAKASDADSVEWFFHKAKSGCQRFLETGLSWVGLRPTIPSVDEVLAGVASGDAIKVIASVDYDDQRRLNSRIESLVLGIHYTPTEVAKYFPANSAVYAYNGSLYSIKKGSNEVNSVQKIPEDFAGNAVYYMGYNENAINMSWLNLNLKPSYPVYEPIFRSMLSEPQASWRKLRDGSIAGRIQIYSSESDEYYFLFVNLMKDSTELGLTRRPFDKDTSYLRSNPDLVAWKNERWAASANYLRGLAHPDESSSLKELLGTEGRTVRVSAGQATIELLKELQSLGFSFGRKLR